jgi:anti-sigma factor RsiW
MNCRELVESITDYLEGQLPVAETQRLEEHLAECPGCRTYLEQMRGLIHAAGKLEEREISTEAKAKLLGIFRDLRNRRS